MVTPCFFFWFEIYTIHVLNMWPHQSSSFKICISFENFSLKSFVDFDILRLVGGVCTPLLYAYYSASRPKHEAFCRVSYFSLTLVLYL